MDILTRGSRPSSFNILKKFYLSVTSLDQYLKTTVSENRYARIVSAAREHETMKKLIETAYVCVNPDLHIVEDDDGHRDISILSTGDSATQSEVNQIC
jgi:hypothetical protein